MILRSKLGHPQGRKVIPVSSGCSSDYIDRTEHIYGGRGFLAPWIPGKLLAKALLLAEMQDPGKGSICILSAWCLRSPLNPVWGPDMSWMGTEQLLCKPVHN